MWEIGIRNKPPGTEAWQGKQEGHGNRQHGEHHELKLRSTENGKFAVRLQHHPGQKVKRCQNGRTNEREGMS